MEGTHNKYNSNNKNYYEIEQKTLRRVEKSLDII